MTQLSATAAFWDDRYKDEDYAYGSEPNDFLREHAAVFGRGARILSLAEGEGRNAVFLAERGCLVRGVDLSEEGRRKAHSLAKARGVAIEYDLADLSHYGMGETAWDGVVSVFCHLSEDHRPGVFSSVIRALKPGGIFLMESYNKAQLELGTGGPRDAAYLVSPGEVEAAFAGFEVLHAQDLFRTIREGSHHNGRSSVTQFLARKPA